MELDQKQLVRLVDRLNSYPVGLPDSPEIREFLGLYLSPEEIDLAAAFPMHELTKEEVSAKVGWPLDRTMLVLESLAEKGCVVDYEVSSGKRFWFLTPSVVGFVEFSLMKLRGDKDMSHLARLMEGYKETHLAFEVFGSKTRLARAVVDWDVSVSSQILTQDGVERLIRESGGGALQTCFCRHHKSLLGEKCRIASHQETCFCLGRAADFVVRRGFGRKVDAEEMLARSREMSKLGLIPVADNVREHPVFICNCCGCCCTLLSGITKRSIPHAVSPTAYLLSVDAERCTACGRCAKTCQIDAIKIVDGRASVDIVNCLGCGACIKRCQKEALRLVPRVKSPHVPRSMETKMLRIALEKGRLWPLVKGAVSRKLKKSR